MYIYRMTQEQRSIFWEVTESVILCKKVYMYMCPVPNGFRDRAISLYSTLYTVQTSRTRCPHTSCTEIELFHCTAHCTLYRRATRHVLTRAAKCIDVDGGVFENSCLLELLLNNEFCFVVCFADAF
jgi:hypothetical protein